MHDSLEALLEATVRREGFTLYHWSLKPGGRRRILRVFLHREDGVGLDDCARVSRRLSAALEEADAVAGSYVLEVSSPGVDRPLLEPWHFEAALGERIRLQQDLGDQGRRSLEGVLLSCEGGQIRLQLGDGEEQLALESISRAKVMPVLKMRRERESTITEESDE